MLIQVINTGNLKTLQNKYQAGLKHMQKSIKMPVYLCVADSLREKIISGEFQPNELMPSEGELSRLYKTSRVTIRQAMDELRRENYISTEKGIGSFVSPTRFRGKFENGGFTRQFKIMGYVPGSKVLDFKMIQSIPDTFRKYVHISDDAIFSEGAYYLKRIRLINEIPIAIQETIVPSKPFPGLESIDFSKCSLYDELANRFEKKPILSDMILLPTSASEADASVLQIMLHDPLMESWAIVYSQDKRIMECSHSVDTNKFAFRVKFSYDSEFRIS
jgi:GntR family transcriptional regulator